MCLLMQHGCNTDVCIWLLCIHAYVMMPHGNHYFCFVQAVSLGHVVFEHQRKGVSNVFPTQWGGVGIGIQQLHLCGDSQMSCEQTPPHPTLHACCHYMLQCPELCEGMGGGLGGGGGGNPGEAKGRWEDDEGGDKVLALNTKVQAATTAAAFC